jgi:hypothetical protein
MLHSLNQKYPNKKSQNNLQHPYFLSPSPINSPLYIPHPLTKEPLLLQSAKHSCESKIHIPKSNKKNHNK